MTKIVKLFAAAALLAVTLGGCSYGALEVTPNNQAVLVKNDMFLAGLLRKAYVCQVTDAGLTNCQTTENP